MGSTYQQRYNQLFHGGLRIRTTLDPNMQKLALDAVERLLPESPFTAALVSMDPANGEVRALVGGPNFEKAKFNLVTQGARQPGSSFKAITLAAAIEEGHSPYDIVDGTAPCLFMKPGWQEPWVVNNYESGAGGVGLLMDATVHSLNSAYANVVLEIGPQKVVDMAHSLGISASPKARPVPLHHPGQRGGHAARHGDGVLDVRGRRRPPRSGVRDQGHSRGRPHVVREPLRRQEGARTANGAQRHRGAAGGHPAGDGYPRCHRATGGGKDGHGRGLARRLVRRLHAAALHRGVDGASRGSDPHVRSCGRRTRHQSG